MELSKEQQDLEIKLKNFISENHEQAKAKVRKNFNKSGSKQIYFILHDILVKSFENFLNEEEKLKEIGIYHSGCLSYYTLIINEIFADLSACFLAFAQTATEDVVASFTKEKITKDEINELTNVMLNNISEKMKKTINFLVESNKKGV